MRPVPSSRSLLARVVDRRTTLALGLGGTGLLTLAASGCDLDDLTGNGGPGSTDAGDPPAEDPDRAVLDGVLVDLDAQLALVVATRAALPRLRRTLRPLEDMHRRHREVLDPTPSTTAPPSPAAPSVPTVPARALARVRAAESTHQASLVTAATGAGSGALARVLASMSASVAQHLALLPTEPPETTR